MSQSDSDGSSQTRASRVPAMLLVKSGFYEGLEVPLEASRTVIGRGRSADLVLAEPTISREHLAVGWNEEGWYVEDLASTNGSYANGSRFECHLLKSGDEIVLGRLILEVALPAGS